MGAVLFEKSDRSASLRGERPKRETKTRAFAIGGRTGAMVARSCSSSRVSARVRASDRRAPSAATICSVPFDATGPDARRNAGFGPTSQSERGAPRQPRGLRVAATDRFNSTLRLPADAMTLPSSIPVSGPLRVKELNPAQISAILGNDPRLIIPIGTCEQHGPHLPLGCDTIIVEHMADDLSSGIWRVAGSDGGVRSERRHRARVHR